MRLILYSATRFCPKVEIGKINFFMKVKANRLVLSLFTVILFTMFCGQINVQAQVRDYFTEAEIELVRDANEIDKRIDVLTKAIDRRFLVIEKDTSQDKQVKKDEGKWGELPSGTRAELLSDIARILQKAIDDIDDLVARKEMNEKLKKGEVKDDLDKITQSILRKNDERFPMAVHNLADAARRYLPKLESLGNGEIDQRERGAIDRSVESCEAIIEASDRVPKPTGKSKKS